MAQHHIMVRATALPNVCGRVDYISNEKRQEHLQAVYSTADHQFWKDLSEHCQEQAKYSKSKKAREGREFMISLANDLSEREPEVLAKIISARMKKLTGTENVVAIHWNKQRKNYHAHVVCSENEKLHEVKQGTVMTRDTYFDAEGKRSTKSKCTSDGELLPGCSMIKKGDSKLETIKFGTKIEKIGSKSFLQDVKKEMAELQNILLHEERFKVFDASGPYIPQQHIGKNKTEEQQKAIERKNGLVRDFNNGVDEILTEASKNGSEAVLKAQEDILMWRQEIKPHKMTNKWLEYIELQIKKIQQRIKKEIQKHAQTLPEASKSHGSSLSDKIALASKKRAQKGHKGLSGPSKDGHGR